MTVLSRRFAILLLAGGVLAQERPAPVKLVTVGNSFANNATFFLREIGERQGAPVEMTPANIGGCDLARHARHLKAYYEDPAGAESRPYRDAARPERGAYSLVEALESADPDYVTLQQVSGDSYKPETFEPYAGELVAAIRRHAPRARILALQTWAYRADHPWFASGELTQEKMFAGLREAYARLAARYGLEVLPVGEAFQIARATALWRFVHPDLAFDYASPAPGSLPNQSGSLVVGWSWRKSGAGAQSLGLDAKHANTAGRYLGACVFHEVLTGRSALGLAWRPEGLSEAQAESLRMAAHLAVFAQREAGAARRAP